VAGAARSGNGTFSGYVTAVAAQAYGIQCGSTFNGSIDNVSVKLVLGNHATASGTTRPIYAIVPKTGRRNLLTNTPFAGAVSGSPGTNPTSWGGALFVGTRTLTLSGETLRLVVNGETNINQTISVAANTNYIFSIKVNVTTASQVQEHIRLAAGPAGSTLSYTIDGSVVSASTTVPTGEHIIASRLAVGATAGTAQARFGCGFDGFSRVCDIVFSEPQAETGTSRTSYQRVVSAYEVTEAGVPSLSYLSFDGVDDFMVTGTITPGTDKAQVFAGVRKLSDAAAGFVAELSTNSTSTAGSFGLLAPSASLNDFQFRSGGSISGIIASASGYPSPTTKVLSGLADIGGDNVVLRVNGSQAAQSSSDQGTGNFLAYPLYIGRRGGSTFPFNGNIYGLITRFGPNLSSALITQTEQWLNTKTQAF
jgi:hypothetical protein